MLKINFVWSYLKDLNKFHIYLIYFFLFILAFGLFFFLQFNLEFADPDSFYHAKMALLIKDEGIVENFPYLEFTVLKDYYIDHHFLYHVLLVPFILFLNPLVGTKLASLVFASLAILVFYWLLKKFSIRGAFYWTLVLVVSNPFIFRLNLAKATVLSIIVLLLGFYLFASLGEKNYKKRYFLIYILSFLYVWLYGGFPLFLVLVLTVFLATILVEFKKRKTNHFFLTKVAGKRLWLCLAGLFFGLVVNPYFPQNLFFYWEQIVKIAIFNYQNIIGVGAEWYAYGLIELFVDASLVFILFFVALTLIIVSFLTKPKVKPDHYKLRTSEIIVLFILTFFFFFLTLKSRRNVEYLIPFVLLFSAFSVNYYLEKFKIKNLGAHFRKFYQKQKWFVGVLTVFIIVSIFAVVGHDLNKVKEKLKGFGWHRFEAVSEWLKNNTPKDSLVFHSDWDDFPLLFYHNSHNHYIVGLDPTFMYDYDERLYWQWVDITRGEEKENLYSIIKNNFGADYVLVGTDHPEMNKNIANNFYFEKVYEDEEAIVYGFLGD